MTPPPAAKRWAAGGGATVSVPAKRVWEACKPPFVFKEKVGVGLSVEFEEKTNTCATAYSHTICSTKLNAKVSSNRSNF